MKKQPPDIHPSPVGGSIPPPPKRPDRSKYAIWAVAIILIVVVGGHVAGAW